MYNVMASVQVHKLVQVHSGAIRAVLCNSTGEKKKQKSTRKLDMEDAQHSGKCDTRMRYMYVCMYMYVVCMYVVCMYVVCMYVQYILYT